VLRRSIDSSETRVGVELDRLQRNIRRCVHIIEDLLDFSRERQVTLQPARIDAWVAAQLNEHELPPGVRLEVDLQAHARVPIDGQGFHQALANLLQNAEQAIALRDHSAGEGLVRVTTRTAGPWLVLAVTDNGAGIRADVRERIFTPLFSTKAFGVGLGMPLVKRIVERHHGTIEVTSAWGHGTTVTIRLPLAGPEGQVRQEVGRKG